MGDDVDEGVADADDVEAGPGHGRGLLLGAAAPVRRQRRRPAAPGAHPGGTVGRADRDRRRPRTPRPVPPAAGAVADALRRRAGARPGAATFDGTGRDRRRRRRAGRRARAQRHRARHRSRSASTAATSQWHLEPATERLVISPVGGLQPGTGRASSSRSRASSTTSCAASTAAPTATTTAPSRSSPRTQMQATDCRRAFPCWDEPDFKAVFGITLVVDPALLAVSNGPEVERRERPRRQGRGALRRHDGDEHLPRRLRRRPARGHRAGRRRRHRRCASCTCPARATSPGSASRSAPSACAGSRTTTASRTRATRSTCSPSPTSPPARWRTSAASRSARALLLVDPATARRTSRCASPTSSPTSWPTCGSATSSRCAGGTASGSTRPSPRSWS